MKRALPRSQQRARPRGAVVGLDAERPVPPATTSACRSLCRKRARAARQQGVSGPATLPRVLDRAGQPPVVQNSHPGRTEWSLPRAVYPASDLATQARACSARCGHCQARTAGGLPGGPCAAQRLPLGRGGSRPSTRYFLHVRAGRVGASAAPRRSSSTAGSGSGQSRHHLPGRVRRQATRTTRLIVAGPRAWRARGGRPSSAQRCAGSAERPDSTREGRDRGHLRAERGPALMARRCARGAACSTPCPARSRQRRAPRAARQSPQSAPDRRGRAGSSSRPAWPRGPAQRQRLAGAVPVAPGEDDLLIDVVQQVRAVA